MGEGGGGGGVGHVTVVIKGLQAACTHTNTHECTQVDAWPMLVANAATMSIPAKMNLLEESL